MKKLTIGERLRQAREAIPASLYEAARETKIRVDFLQSMERDSFRFAWSAYSKGMLRAYARWLRLDDDEMAAEFDHIHGEARAPSVKQIFKEPAQPPPKRRSPRWMIAAALAASTLLVLSLIGVMNPPGPTKTAPAPLVAENQSASHPPATLAQAVPESQGVRVLVSVVGEKCWLRVLADGQERPLFEGNLFRGTEQTFQATERIEIVFGNLGAVSIQVNGRDLGSPGGPGSTGRFVFTPATTGFDRAGA